MVIQLMTKEKLLSYIDHSRSSKNDLILAIEDKITLKHIGNISLQNINWLDRNAEIAFLLFGASPDFTIISPRLQSTSSESVSTIEEPGAALSSSWSHSHLQSVWT